MSAALIRSGSLVAVLMHLVLGHWFWPAADARAEVQFGFVACLGYGHLIGGAWGLLRRTVGVGGGGGSAGAGEGAGRRTWLWGANLATATAVVFVVYSVGLHASPLWLGPLFLVLLWHVAENDSALPRLCDAPRAGLRAAEQGRALALTAMLGLLAIAAGWREGFHVVGAGAATVDSSLFLGLSLSDVASSVVLYHLVSWLLLMGSRAAMLCRVRPEAGRSAVRLLVACHALPLVLLGGALAAPQSIWSDAVASLLLSPGIYLFWSGLHALQTGLSRGIDRAARTA